MTTTVKDIVAAYLRENGYDGLWVAWYDDEDGISCDCTLEKLGNCGTFEMYCHPGYLQKGGISYMDGSIGPDKQEGE